MTDFQRDLEVIIQNVDFNHNGKIRFVLKHANRLKGDVSKLDLSERSNNVLHRNGAGDLETLRTKVVDFNGRGAGKKVIKEVKNQYLAYYYDTLNEEEKKEFWRDTIAATERAMDEPEVKRKRGK